MEYFKWTFCVVIVGVSLLMCRNAHAVDWDRTKDGRVAIDIKGVKFAFPSSGSDLDSIEFDLGRPEHATLRGVLSAPDKYREIFAKSPNTNITLWVTRRDGLYLNRFERGALSGLSFAFDVGDNQRNCSSWDKAFNRAKAEDPKDQKVEYGWRESVTAGIEKVYTRERPGKIQSLYCNERGYCGSSICLRPNLTFALRFAVGPHPKSRWADLLTDVEDVLNEVLPDQSSEKAIQQ